ncbi:MAG: hypothetical protein CVU56_24350 [Deltaproteobacteria bacterium HGW-Deltaproteobacteria-14]|nr:MAG: hypothetical protein CVU56_24350 [Deltaproteobacteria bacterium HGW-Deltaproteobacteria-14]
MSAATRLRPAAIDPGAYPSLGALLRDALVQFKSETALVTYDRKREVGRVSYAEFLRTGLAFARALEDAGVGADDRVAVIMSNQPRWLYTAFATFHRGAVLVPLDYKLTAAEQAALIRHAKPQALITEYPFWRRLAGELGADLPGHVWVSDAPDGVALSPGDGAAGVVAPWAAPRDAAAPTEVPRGRDDDATIVYSSGTGGRPKGCVLTHDNYLVQLESLLALFPMGVGDRFFSILPTNHAIDFMVGFVGPLTCGSLVVHQRTLRPEFLVDTMKRERITHMAVVPLLLEAFERALDDKLDAQPPWKRRLVDALGLVNEALTEKAPRHGLSRRLLGPIHAGFGGHLKLLFCGGAFVDRARAERFYRLGLPVAIGYGLTECCTVATVNDLKPFRGDSVGRAVAGVEVAVRGAGDDGVGEVFVRGRTVMRGYLDDPELTAETLVDGWLVTGDRGWLDAAGHLHLVGRSKNMIVTPGGKNIYPEDIEGAFEGLPAEELCVFAADFLWPRHGHALVGEELVAVVRVEGDEQAAFDALLPRLRELNRRLPDFKRVGGVLRWPDAFPRTASMKLKRNELAGVIGGATARDAVVPIEGGAAPRAARVEVSA